MEQLHKYLLPYIITQVVAVLILLASWKWVRLGRLMFVLLFGWASWTNGKTALTTPAVYLEYATMSIPIYSEFILGWFSHHLQEMILLIASGQFLIAVGMALNSWWVKTACIGAIIFLVAIAPFGVGSGFPFTIVTAFAALLIYQKSPHGNLWKKNVHGGTR